MVLVFFRFLAGMFDTLLGRITAVEIGLLRLNTPPLATIQEAYTDLMQQYPECFTGLGKLRNFQLQLNIDRAVPPVAQPARRLPYAIRQDVQDHIKQLIEMDVVEPVSGPTPWVSPLVVTYRKQGGIRICVDMRLANRAIVRERFPMPNIEELLRDMHGAAVFSVLDLRSSFHQIELEPGSRDITTFATTDGLYRYKRLLFGTSSAPEVQQRILRHVLIGCEGTVNVSDDIIVHGTDVAEHDRRLHKVLHTLRDANLTLNSEKCQFRKRCVTVLGHTLSADGIDIDVGKVAAVVNTKAPTCAKEAKSVMGLVTYCSDFIPGLATLAEPIRRLTRSGISWYWGPGQEEAFETIKRTIGNTQTLAYYSPNKVTRVVVDASPVGLGAILQQQHQDGTFRPIFYASRTLNDVERRYSQTEREALAIYWACQRFFVYLYGRQFVVVTDHKPLIYMFAPSNQTSPRIQRWVMKLQQFQFQLIYRKGERNEADVLSRSPLPREDTFTKGDDAFLHFITTGTKPIALSLQEIAKHTEEDKTLQEVQKAMISGNWGAQELRPYSLVTSELSAADGLVLKGHKIVIPQALQEQVLKLAHEGHLGVVKTKMRLREKVWWPRIDLAVENHIAACHACQLTAKPQAAEPVRMTPLPAERWQILGLDICGPFPNGEYVLVLIDYYSRYPEIAVLSSVTSQTVITWLEKVFATHGLPECITTDRGPQFCSTEFASFLREHGIRHRQTTPYWPSANGEVERFNLVLKKAIVFDC